LRAAPGNGGWTCGPEGAFRTARPEFGGQETGAGELLVDAHQTGASEGGVVVWQGSDPQAGEDPEGEVEESDEELCGPSEWAGGDAEVRDEPQGVGRQPGSESGGEEVELGLGEAVQEEVGDDQIVRVQGWGFRKGQGVGVVRVKLDRGSAVGLALLAEQPEHGKACIDGISLSLRILVEEPGEEAAISVAQSKHLLGRVGVELGQEVEAAAFEGTAKSEVLKCAIGAGDAIEAWLPGCGWICRHQRRKSSRRSGVSKHKSAAARREVGVKRRRE